MWDPTFADDPVLHKVMPAAYVAWYATEESNGFRRTLESQNPALADPETARRITGGGARQGATALKHLADRGGNVL